jgi:hypothetical protein
MNMGTAVRNSALYRWGKTLHRWAQHSRAVQYVTSERVQLGVLALVLVASLVSISGSDRTVIVNFLSFAVLFLLTAIVTWSLTDPFRGDTES